MRLPARRTWWFPIATIAFVGLAGCGGNGSVPDSWVAAEEEYAIFLRWERSGDELNGRGVAVAVGCDDSSPPRCTVQDEESFTFQGTLDGERVRLRTVVGTGADLLVGTLRDERLVLEPDEGGEPLRFRPGSREDYEAAARALRETELIGLSDLELTRRTYALVARVEDLVPGDLAADFNWHLTEVFERFAPDVERAYVEQELGDVAEWDRQERERSFRERAGARMIRRALED